MILLERGKQGRRRVFAVVSYQKGETRHTKHQTRNHESLSDFQKVAPSGGLRAEVTIDPRYRSSHKAKCASQS